MQPANLSLDPMASLWSTNPGPNGSPNPNSNYFSQPSSSNSPDQTVGSAQTSSASNFYASPRPPNQSISQKDGDGGGAGDTFMGASTPGAGMWKWTGMDSSGK